MVVVGVTTDRGERESRSQGEGGQEVSDPEDQGREKRNAIVDPK